MIVTSLHAIPEIRQTSNTVSKTRSTNLERQINSVDRQITVLFRDAISAVSEGRIAEGSKLLHEVRSQADTLGFKDIPDFSFDLLRRAKEEDVSVERRKFLYLQAERLSPEHPGVLMSLATTHRDIGFINSAKYLYKSISNTSEYPVFLATTLARTFVLFGCAIFVATFIVTFLFLIGNAGEIFVSIATIFSRKNRGIFAGLLFPVLLILPLLLPFMLVLCVWAGLIPLLLKRLKWIPFFAAVTVISFTYGMPFAREVITISELRVSKALESVINQNYMPRLQEYLDSVVEQDTKNPMFQVFLAQLQQQRGDLEEARQSYETAQKYVQGATSSLPYIIKHNMGVYAYQKKNVSLAYTEWKKLYDEGWREFELLYNLSIASLVLFEKDFHDSLYSLLLEKYPERAKKLFESHSETPQPLLGKLPKSFFRDIYGNSSHFFSSKEIEFSLLYTSYFLPVSAKELSREIYAGIAIVLLFIWISLCLPKKVSYRYKGSLVMQRIFFTIKQNEVWKAIPFSWCLFESRELFFLGGVTCSVFLLLVACGVPFSLAYEPVSDGMLVALFPLFALILYSIRPFRNVTQSEDRIKVVE